MGKRKQEEGQHIISLAVCGDEKYYTPSDVKNAQEVPKLFCPECLEEIIPKVNGLIRSPHFSHKSGSACSGGGGESYYHRFAKQKVSDNISAYTFTNTCICGDISHGRFDDDHTTQLEQVIRPFYVDVGVSKLGTLVGVIEILHTSAMNSYKISTLYEKTDYLFEVSAKSIIEEENYDLQSSISCKKCSTPKREEVHSYDISDTSQVLLEDADTRDRFCDIKFSQGSRIILKGTAGSGKTTLLVKLCNRNNTKKKMYMCFNNALCIEMTDKFAHCPNISVINFDSLWYDIFNMNLFKIKNLNAKIYDWQLKYIEEINNVLDGHISINDIQDTVIREYVDSKLKDLSWWNFKRLAKDIYDKCKIEIQDRFRDIDVVIVDEAQDMQPTTSKIIMEIINEVTCVIYAGDPDQQLYTFSGAINVMGKIVTDDVNIYTLHRTFRFGNSVCNFVNSSNVNQYTTVPGEDVSNTAIIRGYEFMRWDKNVPYTYIFRSVASMVKTAEAMAKNNRTIDIDFEKRIKQLRSEKTLMKEAVENNQEITLSNSTKTWLSNLGYDEISKLSILFKESQETNGHIVTFATVHAMKGKQDMITRIHQEVIAEKDTNIVNVALTRSSRLLVIDTS